MIRLLTIFFFFISAETAYGSQYTWDPPLLFGKELNFNGFILTPFYRIHNTFSENPPDQEKLHQNNLDSYTRNLKKGGLNPETTLPRLQKTLKYIGHLDYLDYSVEYRHFHVFFFQTKNGKIVKISGRETFKNKNRNRLLDLAHVLGHKLVLLALGEKKIEPTVTASWDFFNNPLGMMPNGCFGYQEAVNVPQIMKQLEHYFKIALYPHIKKSTFSGIPEEYQKGLHLVLRVLAGEKEIKNDQRQKKLN
jgi:hypothetical protein